MLDQAENQFAFTPSVAGVDQGGDVLALGEFDYGIQTALGFLNGLEVEVRRDDRQIRKAPFAAFDVKFFWGLDFHQMADRTRDDIGVVLKMVVMLFELTRHRGESAHDVLRDRRFFGDHQGFTHFDFLRKQTTTMRLSRVRTRARTCVRI